MVMGQNSQITATYTPITPQKEIYMTHNPHNPHNHNYEITAKDCLASVGEQSSLEAWTITTPDGGDKLTISVVMHHKDGVGFTPTDWQGPQPQTVDEIRDYDWVSFGGQGAILPFGLPTLFVLTSNPA
jgi:hypothetical protein